MTAQPATLPIFDTNLRARRRRLERGDDCEFLHKQSQSVLNDRLDELDLQAEELLFVRWEHDRIATKLFGLSRQAAVGVEDADFQENLRGHSDYSGIASIMTLHWVNDLRGFLERCTSLLAHDRPIILVFPGGASLQELRHSLYLAESRIKGGVHPRVSPTVNLQAATMLLAQVGLQDVVCTSFDLNCTYRSPLALMRELRAMGETNALLSSARVPLSRQVVNEACRIYCELFAAPSGRVRATFELLCLTGWTPTSSTNR